MPKLIARPSDRCPTTARKRRAASAEQRRPKAPAVKRAASRNPRRRHRLARILRRSAWLAVAVLAASAIYGGVALWRSDVPDRLVAEARTALHEVSAEGGFAVAEVEVAGRVNTPPEAVLDALSVRRGTPLLALDLQAARQRLEAIGWVAGAAVERRWPDTVRVHLVEREPLALWQHGGALAVIDAAGTVVTRDGLERFGHLPLVVGADAPGHAADLLRTLAADPLLAVRVSAAVRVSGRRWNIVTTDGIDLRLPEQDLAAAWGRLGQLHRRHGLLDRPLADIDLRLPDRLSVTPRPGAVASDGDGTDA